MAKERKMNLDEAKKAAEIVSAKNDADVFAYCGTITRSNVLHVMEEIKKNISRKRLLLVLTTYGGDPHAGFKIARYIQDHYDQFTLLVGGFCKSAGTLFAIAANELVFAPFGELGPLDIQMAKPDHFQFDSGLVIGESLDTLERRACETLKKMFEEVMSEQHGLISINSALHAASELTKAVYAPIMARIDPEEIGARQRALRITLDYGTRLALKSQSVKTNALRMLAEKYSSHAFVIDLQEAASLFRSTRAASSEEMDLIYALGASSRIEIGNAAPTFTVLSKAPEFNIKGSNTGVREHGKAKRSGDSATDGRNPRRTNGSTIVTPKHSPGGRGRGVRTRNPANGRDVAP
jgi:hypothetical protein